MHMILAGVMCAIGYSRALHASYIALVAVTVVIVVS